MTKIEKFEEIQAWQKARELVKSIYGITNEVNFAKDYSLKDQIRRASISIMDSED
jgi:four helix bundle protein